MAGFNIGAGFAQMGETVGRVAGLAFLEQQKSGLEAERLRLANDFAMQRQTQQQGFEMEKLGKTQEFQKGESALDRASAEKRTAMSAGASVESARISAGGAMARLEKEIEFRTQSAGRIDIDHDTGEAQIVNPITGKVKPLLKEDGTPAKIRDPDEARMIAKSMDTLNTQLDRVNDRYAPELRRIGERIEGMTKGTNSIYLGNDKDGKPTAQQQELNSLLEQQEKLLKTWDSARSPLERDLAALRRRVTGSTPAPGSRPPLSSFGGASRTPAMPEPPQPGNGIINY